MFEDVYFYLTDVHLKLLKRVNISFNDGEIDDVPGIDTKRPFGNSDWVRDVAEILEWTLVDSDEWEIPEEYHTTAEKLLKELRDALQVVLTAQSFKIGKYKSKE